MSFLSHTREHKAGLIPSPGHRDWRSAGLQVLQSEPAKDCSQPGDATSDFKVHYIRAPV